MQTAFVTKPRAFLVPARAPSARQGHRVVVVQMSTPKQEDVASAIEQAKDACDGGDAGECAAAWDTVEELSAAVSHSKASGPEDPLEKFCEEDPSADECRVYED